MSISISTLICESPCLATTLTTPRPLQHSSPPHTRSQTPPSKSKSDYQKDDEYWLLKQKPEWHIISTLSKGGAGADNNFGLLIKGWKAAAPPPSQVKGYCQSERKWPFRAWHHSHIIYGNELAVRLCCGFPFRVLLQGGTSWSTEPPHSPVTSHSNKHIQVRSDSVQEQEKHGRDEWLVRCRPGMRSHLLYFHC